MTKVQHFSSPFWGFYLAKDGLDTLMSAALRSIIRGTFTVDDASMIGHHLTGAMEDLSDALRRVTRSDPDRLKECDFPTADLVLLRVALADAYNAPTVEEYRDQIHTMVTGDVPLWAVHAAIGRILVSYGGPVNPYLGSIDELLGAPEDY